MTAATAPYAIEMGLVVHLTEPTTVVHLFNRNTNKTIDVEVPVKDGRFNNEGNCSIAGVDSTAGELKVNFLDPSGVMTMYPYLDDPTKPLNDIVVSGVAVQRTARRIMDGTLYIRK